MPLSLVECKHFVTKPETCHAADAGHSWWRFGTCNGTDSQLLTDCYTCGPGYMRNKHSN